MERRSSRRAASKRGEPSSTTSTPRTAKAPRPAERDTPAAPDAGKSDDVMLEAMSLDDLALVEAAVLASGKDTARPVVLSQLRDRRFGTATYNWTYNTDASLVLKESGSAQATSVIPMLLSVFPLYGQLVALLSFPSAPRPLGITVWMDAAPRPLGDRSVVIDLCRVAADVQPVLYIGFASTGERDSFVQLIARRPA